MLAILNLGGGEILLFLVLLLAPLVLAAFVFWILMLVGAIQNKGLSDGEKVCWVLLMVCFHVLGSLLYFFIGRPKRNAAVQT
jgi:hypothetical protein